MVHAVHNAGDASTKAPRMEARSECAPRSTIEAHLMASSGTTCAVCCGALLPSHDSAVFSDGERMACLLAPSSQKREKKARHALYARPCLTHVCTVSYVPTHPSLGGRYCHHNFVGKLHFHGTGQRQPAAAALSCTPTEIARCHVGSLWGMRGPCPLHSCVGLFQSNIHTYIQSV